MADSNRNRVPRSTATDIESTIATALIELLDAGEIAIIDVDEDGEPIYYAPPARSRA